MYVNLICIFDGGHSRASAIKIPDPSGSVPPDGFLNQQKITINSSTLMFLLAPPPPPPSPLPPRHGNGPKIGNIFIITFIIRFISLNSLVNEGLKRSLKWRRFLNGLLEW